MDERIKYDTNEEELVASIVCTNREFQTNCLLISVTHSSEYMSDFWCHVNHVFTPTSLG